MKSMNWLAIYSLFLGLSGSVALAQTSTSVENLTSISSTTVAGGLGFNMTNPSNDWEFQMAAQAGSTEARFQPSWGAVEIMNGTASTGFTSGGYSMPSNMAAGLTSCATYGIKPLLLAAYGAPYKSIGTFTVAQTTTMGATTIKLNESLANVKVPYCHIMESNGTQIVNEGKWGYYGALISGVDTVAGTITLASATTGTLTLSVGQQLVINELLYPSCATASGTDTSVVAYDNYAAYLATQISSRGLTGRVELWNEPAWAHDPWDHQGGFYDTIPNGITDGSPNFGIAHSLVLTSPSGNVRYNWGGTHKSGGNSLLGSRMSPNITASQVASSISCESFHPYGNSPEDSNWYPSLLTPGGTYNLSTTIMAGANAGGNEVLARQENLNNASYNFQQNITETGCGTQDGVRKARFDVRQYLTFLADGIERVTFYCFAQPNATGTVTLGFVDQTTKAPTQAYTAIQGLVATDMSEIPVAPLTYTASNLPTVPTYSGTYPLTTLSIVGRRSSSDTQNIINYVAWQRSHVAPGAVTNLAVTSTTGRVSLTWSANGYSVGSTLERATSSGGPFSVLASGLPFSTYNYNDSTVNFGTTYYYEIIGNNPAGTSGVSNEVSAVAVATGTGTFNNSVALPGPAAASWLSVNPPTAATVSVQCPTGYTAIDAWDLVTRAEVPFTLSGTMASCGVSDNPVSMQVAPAVFFANFNGDTVGNPPSTSTYASPAANLKPTGAFVTTGEGTLTVVSSVGGLTDQPVQFMKQGYADYKPSLEFLAPSSTPLATTSGVISMEFDETMSSFTVGAHSTETLLTNRVITKTGVALSLNFTVTGTSGGSINFSGGKEQITPTWTFNTPIHFKLVLNLTNQTYSAWANGVEFATNESLTFSNVLGLQIQDGNALGGYDGTWTAGIDNVWISTGLY